MSAYESAFDLLQQVDRAANLDHPGRTAAARRLAEHSCYPSTLGSAIRAARLADHDTQSANCRSKLAAEDRGLGFRIFPLALCLHHETRFGQVITSSGLLLVLWSELTLGRSFGIAPADRGIVQNGPYGFIRHPMYLGELVSLAGALIGDPSIWNIILINILLLTLLLRIRWEELVIFNYGSYAGQVRWRMLPGLW